MLARELGERRARCWSRPIPCFGLDFKAVAEIRSQIMQARNRGAAVLLVSEDLDEILELADRILVISDGKIVYETASKDADRHVIGHHMAGHGHARRRSALMPTIAAQPLRLRVRPGAARRWSIIDMQRDFVEPGGFGAALGNDVSRLAPVVPAVGTLLAAFREPGLTVVHTKECHRPDLSRLPAGQARRAAAARCASATGTDGPHPHRRRAGQRLRRRRCGRGRAKW